MAWTNDDGLRVRFDNEKVTGNTGEGHYPGAGPEQVVEIDIPDATALTSSAAIVAEGVTIPSGARISKVEVVAETACTSGGAAVLNVGLHRLDRTTAIDADGLVAALALTSIDASGDVVELVQGSTGHGALVGTTLANAGMFVAYYGTAAYTAGALKVRVSFYMP